jgi:hypothetical protein
MKTMKAIVVTDQAAGTAGMKLVERPEPQGVKSGMTVKQHGNRITLFRKFVGQDRCEPLPNRFIRCRYRVP